MKQKLRSRVDIQTAFRAAARVAESKHSTPLTNEVSAAGKMPGSIFARLRKGLKRVVERLTAQKTFFAAFTPGSATRKKSDLLANAQEHRAVPADVRIDIEALRSAITSLESIVKDQNQKADLLLTRIEAYSLVAARRQAIPTGENSLLIRTEVGYVLCPQDDSPLVATLLETGDLERGTRLLISRLLRPGDVFVDVGANIGMHTLAAGRAMQGRGKILAFEPFPSTCELLSKTLSIAGLSEISTVFQAAVSSKSGRQRLYLGPTAGHHSLYPTSKKQESRAVSVKVHRLDEIIPTEIKVNLLKVDVEGAELAVIASASQTIARSPDIALIVEFGPTHLRRTRTTAEMWLKCFTDMGFQFRVINEEDGSLMQVEFEQLKNVYSVNLLFLRKDPAFSELGDP